MTYPLYQSIDEITHPQILSKLTGDSFEKTCLEPFETAGWSSTDSQFISIDECGGQNHVLS